MERDEFEQDLHIDPDQLDVEAAMQGEIFFKWAERAVKARKVVDRAKLKMEVIASELASRIRKKPEKYKLEKVTETSVKATVETQEKYKDAQEEHLDAREDQLLLDKAVLAIEQKDRSLKQLIQLHGQEYFAGPSSPRSLTDAYMEETKKRKDRLIKKTKIRKRKK